MVVLVFVPKYAPRWEALLLLFNTTRTLSGPLSTDHRGGATITMDGGVGCGRHGPYIYTGRSWWGKKRRRVLASVLDRCISLPPPTVTREYHDSLTLYTRITVISN